MASSKVIVSRSPNFSMDDVIGSNFTGVAHRSLNTMMSLAIFYPKLRMLTEQDQVVINCTLSRFKTKSKLTNFMKISRIEGYNGK